jgi:hypothetical protein
LLDRDQPGGPQRGGKLRDAAEPAAHTSLDRVRCDAAIGGHQGEEFGQAHRVKQLAEPRVRSVRLVVGQAQVLPHAPHAVEEVIGQLFLGVVHGGHGCGLAREKKASAISQQ